MKWLLTFIPLVLLGCSKSPGIYLNERYLTDENTASLRQAMAERGFDVTSVNIPFPANVERSTVMYSPLLLDDRALDTVVKTLEQEGYSALQLIPLKQGKHWYKQNSLGLYLLPPGAASLASSALRYAQHYQTERCDSHASLTLSDDKHFTYQQNGRQLSGRWEIPDTPYLRLHNQQPYVNFYYRIARETRSDNLGKIDVITLTPMSDDNAIADCRMVVGIRR